jgi:hypothetical protein
MRSDKTAYDRKTGQNNSDFAPDQYPAYLMPDGSWRFGSNAKKIADAAWCHHGRAPGVSQASAAALPHAAVWHS